MKGKVYLASPFFNPEQSNRERSVCKLLRDLGYEVFAPVEQGILEPDADTDIRSSIFNSNVVAIQDSDVVFAITNDKDMGTIWEAGYAFGIGKPVIYYCEDLVGEFNIMLAKSGNLVLSSLDDVEECEHMIDQVVKSKGSVKYEYLGKVF